MAELDTSSKGGHKKGGKKRAKKASTRVDLTPMVDLGFLLVTFFMLTTTFSKPQTMEINMPIKENVPVEEQTAVKKSNAFTILVGGENKLFWYQGMVNEAEATPTNYSATGLRQILLQKKAQIGKDMVVMIKPTEKANYKNVVDVLDEMNITNIGKYAIVDITPDDLALIKDR